MKIKLNNEIRGFFDRCFDNLENVYINDYVGITVKPEEEYAIQEELCAIGVPEFQGDDKSWPSLYINTDEFKKTPYNANIRLDKVSGDGFEFSMFNMPAYELFNVDFIQRDPNRELNDFLVLRAFDKTYESTILRQDGDIWMTDAPAEANTSDPCVAKAHGKVLTYGLGIGYFVYMCLLKSEVEKVTIIERSSIVIKMFKKFILPQFPRNIDVEIIEGDAFDYYNEEFIAKFDYVFVDVWKSNNDGFEMIERMLETYIPPFEKVDFWIEVNCFEFLSSMIFVYFEYTSRHQIIQHEDPFYDTLYQKIDRYFSKIEDTVSDVDTLKYYMYDMKVLREIVGLHL